MLVHQAVDTALLEHRAANGRVALDLEPLAGLLDALGRDRQVAQVEVGADLTQDLVILSHDLQRGQ